MSTEHLVKYKGVPVPWVARWSNERSTVRSVAVRMPVGQSMRFPEVTFPNAQRDDLGILWQPDGTTRGGVPEFGDVNTHRQVACMRHKRCQVCGNRLLTSPYNLLVIDKEAMQLESTLRTTTPMVCDSCAAEAMAVCPALRKGRKLYKVKSFEPVAVWGPVYHAGVPAHMMPPSFDVPLEHEAVRSVIGKQMVVKVEIA